MKGFRVTIFWRAMLAQGVLIGLVLGVSLYGWNGLKRLADLTDTIASVDSACIHEEKRLLKVFLGEMRNAEKYLLLKDTGFRTAFLNGSEDFNASLEKIDSLVDSDREQELVRLAGELHAAYGRDVDAASQVKTRPA
ncbi:MAG: hypothetical protein ACLGPL_07770, partial [Acidobacteriota bacterium]